MKKMRVLFTVLVLSLSLNLVAQSERNLVAAYNTIEDILVVKDGKASSNFVLFADAAKVKELQEKAESFNGYLILGATQDEKVNNKYFMSLQFKHEAQLSEFHKNLVHFGFTSIKIQGVEFPLDHLLTIKK